MKVFSLGIIVLTTLGLGISAEAMAESAGCLVRLNDQILMSRDAWSKKWSLPGGGLEDNETAAQAAVRELREETGLVATAGERIATWGSFAVFDCRLTSAIPNGVIVPTPSVWNEVMAVSWMDPLTLTPKQWRFPEQRGFVLEASRLVESQVGVIAANDHYWLKPGAVLVAELSAMRTFQSALHSPAATAIFRFFSLLGEEPFFILLLPFLWWMFGRRFAVEAMLLFVIAGLLHGILKEVFAIPRPFHFDPSLQLGPATGFGFPSGHTVTVTVVWGFLASFWSFRGRWWVAGVIAFMGGLSRVYLGVHFPHDVLGGWALGILIIWGWRRALLRTRADWIEEKVWLLLLLITSLISLIVRFNAEMVTLVSVAAGVFVGLKLLGKDRWVLPIQSLRWRMVGVVGAILGALAIQWIANALAPQSATFEASLLHGVMRYGLLGFWLGMGAPFFRASLPIQNLKSGTI